jgi:uncharacterized membrane protein
MPSPDILARYRNSGMARELLDFVRKEQEHRHELQLDYLLSYRRGQSFGFFLFLFSLWAMVTLVKSGHRAEAYTLGGALLLVVLAVNLAIRPRTRVPEADRPEESGTAKNPQQRLASRK